MAKANGPAITAWRETRGMTSKDLATRAEISQAHLSRLQSGVNDASEEVLARLARALGVQVAVISDVRRAEQSP